MTIAPVSPPRGRIDKRSAILEAALRIFILEGYGLARIENVAHEAGVAKPTIYNHFGDKQTLFRVVMREGAARTSGRILDAIDSLPESDDIETYLTRLAHEVIACELSDEGWALQRLMFAEAARFPDLFDEALSMGGGRVHNALAGRLARLAGRGLLDIQDFDLATRQFQALVSGSLPAVSALGTRRLADPEIATEVDAGVQTFLRAFSPRST